MNTTALVLNANAIFIHFQSGSQIVKFSVVCRIQKSKDPKWEEG